MKKTCQEIKRARCGPADVLKELMLVGEIVDEWNLHHGEAANTFIRHAHWTTDAAPDMSDRAQAVINRQIIDKSDILVAVFWTRFGTPTGEADSGTEEEVLRAIKLKKRVLLYFSDLESPSAMVDEFQLSKVSAFRQKMGGKGLYWSFRSRSELREAFRGHLAQIMNEMRLAKKTRKPSISKAVGKNVATANGGAGSVALAVIGGINAPVTIQNFQQSSAKPPRGFKPNSIGADANRSNYIDYLCDLYVKYMAPIEGDVASLWGKIGKQIKTKFRLRSRTRNDLALGRFDDLVDWIVNEKLAKTPVGQKHLRNGSKLCRSFNDYVSGAM
jgi:nucleoside 2-deoxyribosyltransferase